MIIVEGNILDAPEQYIAQQCNCVGKSARGLSAQIAARYPEADVYKMRSTPSTPGTIQVCGRVICMFSQYGMGRPGAYGQRLPDTYQLRLQWFKQCLEHIAALNPASVAIPYGIGCGLAGGNWSEYNSAIYDWSIAHPSISVVIYKL